jgi:hypothetical protein
LTIKLLLEVEPLRPVLLNEIDFCQRILKSGLEAEPGT